MLPVSEATWESLLTACKKLKLEWSGPEPLARSHTKPGGPKGAASRTPRKQGCGEGFPVDNPGDTTTFMRSRNKYG